MDNRKFWSFCICYVLLALLLIFASRCTSVPNHDIPNTVPTPQMSPSQSPGPLPTQTPSNAPSMPLPWEKEHQDLKLASVSLYAAIDRHWSSLSKATDASFFCPKWGGYSDALKKQCWALIIVWDTYYECSWDASQYSVDVGSADDKNSWSVGLLQLSVVDQESYGFPLGFNFADLQNPAKNLVLGMDIMAHQIDVMGKIRLTKGDKWVYWATMLKNGNDDASDAIAAHVKASMQ